MSHHFLWLNFSETFFTFKSIVTMAKQIEVASISNYINFDHSRVRRDWQMPMFLNTSPVNLWIAI